MLADVLWTRYDLEGWDQRAREPEESELALAGDRATASNGTMPGRDQELEWLKASFPSERADVSELLDSVIRTIGPLAKASGTQVACAPCAQPCSVIGQLASIRQALLNLITAAVHSAPGGEVRIDVMRDPGGVAIRVCASSDAAADESSAAEVAEHLQMIQQLAPLCDGELEVASRRVGSMPFAATLTLPENKQSTVLAIDDNVDTLRLLERYLSSPGRAADAASDLAGHHAARH